MKDLIIDTRNRLKVCSGVIEKAFDFSLSNKTDTILVKFPGKRTVYQMTKADYDKACIFDLFKKGGFIK